MMLGEPCRYITPCGWCWKWDKKCDKKIGCGDDKPPRGLRAKGNFINDPADAQVDITKLMKPKDPALEYIKSGKGLPPLGAYGDFGLQTINERKPRK